MSQKPRSPEKIAESLTSQRKQQLAALDVASFKETAEFLECLKHRVGESAKSIKGAYAWVKQVQDILTADD